MRKSAPETVSGAGIAVDGLRLALTALLACCAALMPVRQVEAQPPGGTCGRLTGTEILARSESLPKGAARDAAVRYMECAAWSGPGGARDACRASGGERDSVAGRCFVAYSVHAFMRASAYGEAPAGDHCSGFVGLETAYAYDGQRKRAVCSKLAEAYPKTYTTVCRDLAREMDNAFNSERLFFVCRTFLHPDRRSCQELARPDERSACLDSALILEALKARDVRVCGNSEICRAVLPGRGGGCGRLEAELVRIYCESSGGGG